MGSVKAGEKLTKIQFWGLDEALGEEKDSYTARVFLESEAQILASAKHSFSYRNPTLSTLKVVDFVADSEKASTLLSPRELSFLQMPQPGIVDLKFLLLSDQEILYSETLENLPVLEASYQTLYWPFLLEKGKDYTALLKVREHSPALITVYRSDFSAAEAVKILDRDVDVDEYGASVSLIGQSQVPFDGIVRVVLKPKAGAELVFEEPADLLPAGREDTVGIIWQGIPKGDYKVQIQVLNREGKVLDSHETVLRIFEPDLTKTPVKETPSLGTFGNIGIFLASWLGLSRGLFPGRKAHV